MEPKRNPSLLVKLPVLAVLSFMLSGAACHPPTTQDADIKVVSLENIQVKGELRTRILKNFDRLEESKYQPDSVFLTEEESGNWPGDTEGRTILGLVLDARASHRTPKYLQEIIRRVPEYLNEEGYMGLIYTDVMNEQQLSGNGWMLRGLCEYYEWTQDEQVLEVIASITNLFIKGKGYYRQYPIEPQFRNKIDGAESGSIMETRNGWMLSSDIGCVFVGMEGAIHAYKHLKTPELKEVITEMINRFLEMNLVSIKAQTHSALTACRGLIRFAEITGEQRYIEAAAKNWQLYKMNGMTENYENYNWFGRFDKWTEPCAIVDSYLLAVQLWQHTRNPQYLNDAERIYYNGICHTQRYNGGFGCDNCPGRAIHDACLKVHVDEAHWCCTMRGGEGLSRAAEYAYFTDSLQSVYIPFFHESELSLTVDGKGKLSISQQTDYPFDETVKITIQENTVGKVRLYIRLPSGTSQHQFTYNGKAVHLETDRQFALLSQSFRQGDRIELSFVRDLTLTTSSVNPDNTDPGQIRIFYGPLMLGYENGDVVKLSKEDRIVPDGKNQFRIEDKKVYLTPVYHLMDRKIWKDQLYKKQILF